MKKSKKKQNKLPIKKIIAGIVAFIIAIFSGAGIGIVIKPTEGGISIETTFGMQIAEKQMPAELETIDGEKIIDEDIVTIEEVTSNQLAECNEGEECGQGRFIYAPTETPQAFKEYVYGRCWDTDGHYGSQCWDLADLFFQNYAGRNFSTCGTGGAKGSWNCKEYNAGNEFDLIYNPEDLQTGDWVIFSSGTYGHVGMAMGNYNNGYISLLGQNQGGSACEGGGASANIINISLKTFVGAFRPKTYIKPDPTPIPISNCVQWHVIKGDTMSKIMLECENTVKYGEAMNDYAKTWFSLVYNKGKSVYDGWTSPSGVGLYENDDIEHRL